MQLLLNVFRRRRMRSGLCTVCGASKFTFKECDTMFRCHRSYRHTEGASDGTSSAAAADINSSVLWSSDCSPLQYADWPSKSPDDDDVTQLYALWTAQTDLLKPLDVMTGSRDCPCSGQILLHGGCVEQRYSPEGDTKLHSGTHQQSNNCDVKLGTF